MQFPLDDAIHRVDDRFLGPKERRLPAISYREYAVGVTVGLVLFALAKIGGIPLDATTVTWGLGATVGATWAFYKLVTPDRNVRALVTIFFEEVWAPRPPAGWSHRWRLPTPPKWRSR